MYFHVKTFNMNVPIDVLVDNEKFPGYEIAHEKCSSNFGIVPVGIFELKDAKHNLAQVSWVTKNKLLRPRRFLEVQLLDVTCKKTIIIAH